jgi:hypothetical protein
MVAWKNHLYTPKILIPIQAIPEYAAPQSAGYAVTNITLTSGERSLHYALAMALVVSAVDIAIL